MFSGCKNNSTAPREPIVVAEKYSAIIDVVFGETEFKANLTKHSSQKYEINILTPEILKTMSLNYNSGKCTVTYEGLTFEADLNRFPQSEIGALLVQALNDTENETVVKSFSQDGVITNKGITDYGNFTLLQDSETGLWKELSVEGASLKVLFSDYKINSNTKGLRGKFLLKP